VGQDLQQQFHLTGALADGAEAVAEVAFEHADHRLGLRALAVRFAGLTALELSLHPSSVAAGRGLGAGAAGGGLDP